MSSMQLMTHTPTAWLWRVAMSSVVALALSACGGGGGNSGDPVLGGGDPGTVVKVADLVVSLDKESVPSTGAEVVAVTVMAVDANRAGLANVPVSFAIDSGGTVSPAGTVTSAEGKILATAEIGNDPSKRTITITASASGINKTASFAVVDPVITVPKADKLTMVLDKPSVGNSGSDAVTATVTAVGAGGNVVVGIPVSFSVDTGTVAPNGTQTDARGEVTAAVKIGADKSNRLITVTATSGSLEFSASFLVNGAKLSATALPALPAPGQVGSKVEFRLSDVNQSAMPGVAVNISAPGLPSATGSTNANGVYVYEYTAPTTPGPIDITALAGGAKIVQTVTVPSGTSTVPPVTVAVTSASLSASPDVVPVNEASAPTANRAEIRALFFGAGNVPVKNIRVRFDRDGDANAVPGSLNSGTSLVYSDAVGAAVTSYVPGVRPSPTNGVTIRACWDYNDFAEGLCPNAVRATLTVVSDPISITIGTNELILTSTNTLNYIKQFVLQVVDAAGNPKADVQITPSIDLLGYYKGRYMWDAASSTWLVGVDRLDTGAHVTADSRNGLYVPYCQNEDGQGNPKARNGVIDAGEDINSNAQLDPRKSDVSISMVNGGKTDANGNAVLKIEYAKSVASWVAFRIQASALGVLSPPAIYDGVLPFVGSAVKSADIAPAFVFSPYGVRGYMNDNNGLTCRSAN
ncbi:hypothetical protein [Paucibacter sp. XJ19-41]|uniref:hypothetical protein n=1 Tax=Paucibacter sp. XJ19-41 TaxID=2927824 RepID=UPI002349EFDB|nr:hypothetical protein [Paucibacter sp. XJ19-41]MDC6166059.1 hypothetical protein [Paucibacter sp. XJ19-41]